MIPNNPQWYGEGPLDSPLFPELHIGDNPRESYSYGPAFLNDSAGNLTYKIWKFTSDGMNVYADGIFLFKAPNTVVEISGTFDQLGHPIVGIKVDDVNLNFEGKEDSTIYKEANLYLFWYNSLTGVNELFNIGIGRNPFAIFDLLYSVSNSSSDYIIFYVRSNKVYYRVQRDRLLYEYFSELEIDNFTRILRVEMTDKFQLQIVFSKYDELNGWLAENKLDGNWVAEV